MSSWMVGAYARGGGELVWPRSESWRKFENCPGEQFSGKEQRPIFAGRDHLVPVVLQDASPNSEY